MLEFPVVRPMSDLAGGVSSICIQTQNHPNNARRDPEVMPILFLRLNKSHPLSLLSQKTSHTLHSDAFSNTSPVTTHRTSLEPSSLLFFLSEYLVSVRTRDASAVTSTSRAPSSKFWNLLLMLQTCRMCAMPTRHAELPQHRNIRTCANVA